MEYDKRRKEVEEAMKEAEEEWMKEAKARAVKRAAKATRAAVDVDMSGDFLVMRELQVAFSRGLQVSPKIRKVRPASARTLAWRPGWGRRSKSGPRRPANDELACHLAGWV